MTDAPFVSNVDRKLRGHYVRLSGQKRHCKSYCRRAIPEYEWHDWKFFEEQGILSFGKNGLPTMDGEHIEPGGQLRNLKCELLWKVPFDSLRCLCRVCVKTHPLVKCLEEMRSHISQASRKDDHCSICKGRGFIHIPSRYWRFATSTPYEEIEKDLISDVFWRNLKDANAELVLHSCTKQTSPLTPYISCWITRANEYYHVSHDEPLAAGMWERWVEMSEIKRFATTIRSGQATIFQRVEESA